MKTPRDVDATQLLKLLNRNYGYEFVRQTGSHIRLKTSNGGEHHVTIPNHSPLRVRTLNQIISEIAVHFKVSKEDVMNTLFN